MLKMEKFNKTRKTDNFKKPIPQNAIKTMVVKALPQIVHFMHRYHMRTSEYILIMKKHT